MTDRRTNLPDQTTLPDGDGEEDYRRKLREMNEALLVSSVRQHELTEQAQQAERALAKALAYSDDIIATLREPFLILDPNLYVKTANRSFCKAFHVSKEETEDRLVFDLGDGQWDIPALRKLLHEVLSRKQPMQDFEVEHDFPSLGHSTMLLNARPFPPDSEHPELILLAISDVSEMRQRADDLADLNHRKDEFLAMLSHELRNPLAAIANAVNLLHLEGNENPLQHEARTIIERQVGQLKRLIGELLEVSRISTGRVQLRLERVSLGGIVEQAVETARPTIAERRHELVVTVPPEPIWVNADASRLEQVVVNLLTNAAKYTDEEGHITLSLEREGDEAVLRVRDSGIGIPPELLPRIFDLFTQADRSLARSEGGLGIGLALVQRLVELHQGRVEAHSSLGVGSEFVVRLPVLVTAAPPPPHVDETAKPTTTNLRVLVVDDNADASKTMAMLLRKKGHEARTAHDGPTAVAGTVDFRPDVVLLDIGLPGFDGYEVARRIRRDPALEHVVMIAMTGYGQPADLERSQEAGIDQHLVKPIDYATLQKLLADVKPARD